MTLDRFLSVEAVDNEIASSDPKMSPRQVEALSVVRGADERREPVGVDTVALAIGFPVQELIDEAQRRGVLVFDSNGTRCMRATQVMRVFIEGGTFRGQECWRELGGGVYFIKCGDFIKIGTSVSIRNRLAAFATSNPYDFLLLLFICTHSQISARKLEGALHRKFAVQRHRGEWFKDCPEIAAFIAEQS